jgi:hypothetical protein
MKTHHRQITLTELKSRLSFLGYSVKKSGDEYEVYPNRKRGEASYFTNCTWDAYLTAKADALQRLRNTFGHELLNEI